MSFSNHAAVTDRPDPNIGEPLNSPGPDRSSTSQPSAHMLTPNGLSTLEVHITTKQQPTPEEIRPFSKALPRKQNMLSKKIQIPNTYKYTSQTAT